MTIQELLLFAALLITPTIYQRTKFFFSRKSFDDPQLRKKSGLQIHHGHWGFLIALVTMYLVLFFDIRNSYTFALAGLGWGLMLDEIPPMLKMPTPGRQIELDVYAKTQNATFILIGSILVISVGLFLLV